MLTTMVDLMQYGFRHSKYDFILGSSAVAHTFCRQNADCDENTEIIKMVEYLEEILRSSIHASAIDREIEERVIVTMKALGNIGVVTEEFKQVLQNIIEDDNILLEIRLQAVYAFRRLDCYEFKYDLLKKKRNLLIEI